MAVNPDVYGTINDWVQYANGGGTTANLRTYTLTDYIASRTQTPIGQPIDKSLSCSGLGTESALSHRKFFDTDSLVTLGLGGGGVATPTIIEDRTVTNWCFGDTQHNYDGGSPGQRFSVIVDGDGTQRGTNAQEMRYAPTPVSGWWNPSNIKPVVQFSHKNIVARLMVDVSDTKAWNASLHSYTLDEYLTSYTDTYPYIYGVYFDLWTHVGSTSSSRQRVGRLNNCAIAILDNVQLPKTNPYMYNLVSYGSYNIKLLGGFPNQSGKINTRGGTDSTNNKTYIGCCCPDTWETYIEWATTTNNEIHGYTCRTYDETFHDEVFEQIACLGILFTADTNTAEYGTMIDDTMHCGVLDEHLIGHGKWTSGIKNALNDQLDWRNSNDSTYDPAYVPPSGGGDDPYDAATDYITAGTGINVGGRWYCDDNLNIWLALINWCNGIDLATYTTQENFYGQNPIDCILEGKIIFIGDYTFGKTIQGSDRQPMVIGSYSQDGIGAWAFTHAYPETFDCGDVTINKIYGDFRDLEPYTTYTALLPFASSVELPSDIVVGHTVSLTETIDPQSGDLKYRLLVDGCEYATSTGNCAIDLSINGLEIATYRQNRFSLQTQQQTAAINSISSLIGGASGGLIAANYGNIAGAASQIFGGIVNMTNSLNQSTAYSKMAERLKPSPAKIQNATPNVEWGRTPFPCIVASSPRMLAGFSSLESYRQRVGFATYTIGQIKDQKYAVVCENVVLSGFSCTKEEMTMIKQLLESGIYIK